MTAFTLQSTTIVLPKGETSPSQRLRVSSGSCTPEHVNDGPAYEDSARIPREPWTLLNDRELQTMTSPHASLDTATTVWIINISTRVLGDLQPFKNLCDQREVSTLMNEPAQRRAIAGLVEHCTGYCTVRDGFTVQGVAVRDRGRCTTTIDTQKNARIGIHLDSWDRLPIPRRATARNRLNVNLGAGDRHFLFAARSIMEISKSLHATDHLSEHPTGLAREWLRIHPDEPIYSVTVRPGEAYIAPTEVLPHDSSTTGKVHMDISLTILGHFKGERR